MNLRAVTPIVLIALVASSALAQSTAFTYQGELKNAGALANGLYDLRFKLFDSATSGTQIGSAVCVDNVQVAGGKFTATIDFGAQFANNAPRFIEIDVRQDSGLGCGNSTGFTSLIPRQAITPTPRASAATTAFSLSAPGGSLSNAVVVANSGNVGIGTTNPGAPIHIASQFAVLNLQDTGLNPNQTGYVSFRNASGAETAWVGFGTAGDPDFSIVNARSGGDIVLNPFSGNVGIGTSAPAAKLDVRGEIRVGSSGQFQVAAGEERVRIIRGAVNSSGAIIRGSGFTASRIDVGKYRVTFDTPFPATPTATATPLRRTGRTCEISFDVGSPAPSQITFVTGFDGGFDDNEFNFIVIGPR